MKKEEILCEIKEIEAFLERLSLDEEEDVDSIQLLKLTRLHFLRSLLRLTPKTREKSILIYKYAKSNQVSELDEILSEKQFRWTENAFEGESALHIACYHGNVAVVNLLLLHGVRINQLPHPSSYAALLIAAERGFVELVGVLVDEGADVAQRSGGSGHTALMGATYGGFVEVMKTLIDNGADVFQEDLSTSTAVHQAAYANHVDAMKFLISRGADPTVGRSADNYSALHAAARYAHMEMMEFLVTECGVSVNIARIDGLDCLMQAAQYGKLDAIKFFVERGATVKSKRLAFRAVYWAAQCGHLDIVKYLLEHGEDLSATAQGYTPLMAACYGGKSLPLVRFLVEERQLDVNAERIDDGYTALMAAGKSGSTEIIKYLIDAGANVQQCGNGLTPLMWLIYSKASSVDAVRLLIDAGADATAIDPRTQRSMIFEARSPDILQLFLDKGIAADTVDEKTGFTPLITHSFALRADNVKLLLKCGANVNHTCSTGTTALIEAAYQAGNSKVCKVLLDHGADIEHVSPEHLITALSSAVYSGSIDTLQLLLARGARNETKTHPRKNALSVALSTSRGELADVLLENLHSNRGVGDAPIEFDDSILSGACAWPTAEKVAQVVALGGVVEPKHLPSAQPSVIDWLGDAGLLRDLDVAKCNIFSNDAKKALLVYCSAAVREELNQETQWTDDEIAAQAPLKLQKRIVEIGIIFFELPSYVLLEIVDRLPGMSAIVHHVKIEKLIEIKNSIRKIKS